MIETDIADRELVATFRLPLTLAPPVNRTMHGRGWQLGKIKRLIAEAMAHQHAPRREPLEGVPLVRCIRASSVEPDRTAAWSKFPVDVLCAPSARSKQRLNFIRDDRPSCATVVEQWIKAPRGQGGVVIEVWSGKGATGT